MVQDDPRHNLRMTLDLQKRLKHAAIENHRSLNAEIVARLELSFSGPLVQLAEALRVAFTYEHALPRDRVARFYRELADLLERDLD